MVYKKKLTFLQYLLLGLLKQVQSHFFSLSHYSRAVVGTIEFSRHQKPRTALRCRGSKSPERPLRASQGQCYHDGSYIMAVRCYNSAIFHLTAEEGRRDITLISATDIKNLHICKKTLCFIYHPQSVADKQPLPTTLLKILSLEILECWLPL